MRPAITTIVLATLVACGGSDAPTLSDFVNALENDASCARLFEIRNEFDPKDPQLDNINSALRNIGCYSATSTRTR